MTTTNVLEDVRAGLDAAAKVKTTDQSLRARHGELLAERNRVWGALQSRQEVLANKDRLVDELATSWRADHAMRFVSALSAHQELRSGSAWWDEEREIRISPRIADLHNVFSAPGAVSLRDLCGICPDIVKAGLEELIDATPETYFGLAPEERRRRLAELDREITNLEAQHCELVTGAGAVGIELQLLDTVRERRELESLRADRAERERKRQATPAPSKS